jgi:hypothetical protein
MDVKLRLPFGLRNGQLLTIDQVASGLACDCVCPACGSRLVAKKGKVNRPHFAHHRSPDCPQATETALHLFAKDVIRRAGRIFVPQVTLPHTGRVLRYRRIWYADECTEEEVRGSLRADLVLRRGDRELAVEIKVHHGVPNYKVKHFIRQRLTALEIDVDRIFRDLLAQRGHRWRVGELRNAILYGARYRRWLFHPQQHAAEYALRLRAKPRPVKYYRRGNRHYYSVFGCPLQTEARLPTDIWQACAHCRYGLEIEFAAAWQGYRYVVKTPRRVWCLGEEADDELE